MVVGSNPTWGTNFKTIIKCKIITGYVGTNTNLIEQYDKKVTNFIEELSKAGHTFINSTVSVFGSDNQVLRTQIIYQENQSREVIFEKTSS